MTLAWLLPMVSAGLLGSAHCIGMCGGLIAVATDGVQDTKQRWSTQLAYQAARLGSYVTLGILAGALGRALDLAGRAAGLGQAAAVLAGATMTLWGLAAMVEAGGARLKLPQLRLLPTSVTRFLTGLRQRSPLTRAMLLGGTSAFLPCGFLYAFALAGAATGSPLGGALVMAALWLGNLPALLGFSWLLSGVLSRLKRHIPLLSAACVFGLGVLTLTSRVNLPAFALAAAIDNAAQPVTAGQAPSAEACPFHKRRTP